MKAAVIGAGINGLFVTRELLSRGCDVTVFDTCLYGAQKRASSGSRAVTVLYQKPGLNLDIMTESFNSWFKIIIDGYLNSPSYIQNKSIYKLVDLIEIFDSSKQDAANKLFNDISSCNKVKFNNYSFLSKSSDFGSLEKPFKAFKDDTAYYLVRPKAMLLLDAFQYLKEEWRLVEKGISIRNNYANRIANNSIDGENFDLVFICNGAWASQLLRNWGNVEANKFVSSQIYLPFDYKSELNAKMPQLATAIRDYRNGSYFYYPGVNNIQPKAMKNNYGPVGQINIERQDSAEEEEVKKWLQDSVLGYDVDFSKSQTCHYLVNPDGLPITGSFDPINGAWFVLEAPGSGFRTAPTLAKLAVDAAINSREIDNSMSPNRFIS